ncbi:MAG: FAD-dependent oxidoreductase [Giesbergeria sp.]|uniref:FAD-dependent oxidoreductase n=1 Tax=Giesbergeria sp. TaxID=2818473 RepID=UPI002621B918|nr:FAD-dependent oxidoreductase [Giesbergeria sp.]MDD2610233.1 FAD-dependent oxidoreductase [Giesbergeria sp.]
MSTAVQKVLIIGGGFSGMAAAICLSRQGIGVDLVEIDPQWQVAGAGLTMGGASLRAIEDLGLLDEFLHYGSVVDSTQVFTPDDQLIATMPTPILTRKQVPGNGAIMRADLARIMERAVRAAGGVDIRLGCTFTNIKQDAEGVEVCFTDDSTRRYDLVVGADGVFSKVRQAVFPQAPKPAYSGQSVWRAMLTRPAEVTSTRLWTDQHTKVGINPVNREKMYLFVNEFRPVHEFLEPSTFLPTLKDLLKPFSAPMVQWIRSQLSIDSQILFRPLEGMLMPQPWYEGRVVLMGDAVHATTPHLGSGACIGIEDGIVLAQELTTGPLNAALQRYSTRRWERCRMVVENSARLGEIEKKGGDKQEHARIMRESFIALAQAI